MKVRLFDEERQALKAIAMQNGYQYAGEGSVSLLLRAIANGTIKVTVNDFDVPEGGEFTGIRISPDDKVRLDDTILSLNLTYGQKPSYSLFLKAIANSQATLEKNIFRSPLTNRCTFRHNDKCKCDLAQQIPPSHRILNDQDLHRRWFPPRGSRDNARGC